jgi:drug/metabolite transporter (DMT)-like permease
VNQSRRAALLLLLNGAWIAAHTLLAKQASGSGVPPMLYALASAGGATVILALVRTFRRTGPRFSRHVIVYGLIAGLISGAIPQTLIYSASAYVSAGVASLAYAFPTPLTFVLAALFGLERATLGRAFGIAIAFGGALLLALSRSRTLSGDGLWIVLAMLAPFSIAFGNIYRTRYWPEGATPFDLAVATSAGNALWLGLALAATGGVPAEALAPPGLAYLGVAALIATFGNVIYFELQRTGGIVSFSQIGYAGAVLGLLGGWLILGERYAALTWLSALIIALGILVSEVMKRRAEATLRHQDATRASGG